MALTTEQQAQIVALRALGRPYQAIADEVGASKVTVMQYTTKTGETIARERRRILEELLAQHRLLLRDRLEDLATFAGRLRKEIEQRPLGSLSTSLLWKLYLDTLKALQDQQPLVTSDDHASDIEEVYLFDDTL